ncbi:hypothetical protein WN48_11288 [Eufriesea mexicana]|uniref:Uncharacterized protein n=1 Tax=Eufriesea mexicana TaxID=516756 RepID=A0A310SD86_9HYME|nr:hypothetical protein WN48_11288 [Eufriesea mexicana]
MNIWMNSWKIYEVLDDEKTVLDADLSVKILYLDHTCSFNTRFQFIVTILSLIELLSVSNFKYQVMIKIYEVLGDEVVRYTD